MQYARARDACSDGRHPRGLQSAPKYDTAADDSRYALALIYVIGDCGIKSSYVKLNVIVELINLNAEFIANDASLPLSRAS